MSYMETLHLTAEQIQAIRYMEQRYLEGNSYVGVSELAEASGMQESEVDRFLIRLEPAGIVKYAKRPKDPYAAIQKKILVIVDDLNNLPPRNYRTEFETWFYSQWWSIPARIVFIGLPALVGYVAMLQTVLRWLGVID